MIKLTPSRWDALHTRLKNEYPPSVMILRYKMREVLGFTIRQHREWVTIGVNEDGRDYGHYVYWVCLDFYNDQLETFFRLKYSDVLWNNNGPELI